MNGEHLMREMMENNAGEFYTAVINSGFSSFFKRRAMRMFALQFRISCNLCEGNGHHSKRCSTRKKIKRTLNRMGLNHIWIAVKHIIGARSLVRGRA